MKTLLALVVLLSAVGCAQVQQPYRFSFASGPNASAPSQLDNLVRALASNGVTPASIDRQAGIVYTQWLDTGFMFGEIAGATATIVRRYIITLTPIDSGTDVLLRADTQRCAQGRFTVGDNGLQGNCEIMTGVVPSHQKALDALGEQLKSALSSQRPAPPPPG